MINLTGVRFVGLLAGLLICVSAVHARRTAEQTPAAAQGGKPPAAREPGQARPPVDRKNVVEGSDEDDALKSSDDDSWLFGKKGSDFLRGGKGRDVVDGSDGDDTIDGGDGNDVLDGGGGNDTIRGAGGNDTIDGGDNDDQLDGGAGNDDLDGGDDNDVLRGGAGEDVLAGGDGDDLLNGGAGADRLSGNDGADTLVGGADADRLVGGDGEDSVSGEAGDDFLDGGLGNDVIRGGTGNDTLLGSSGADTLEGGDEFDILVGGDGRDVLNGSSGDDLLLGGAGADLVSAGDGNDIIVLRAGDVPSGEFETVDGEGSADRLILNGFSNGVTAGQADVLSDPWTGGTYRLRNIERVEHTHVFTDVGTSAARPSSSLVLVNSSSTTAVEGRIVFSGDDGNLLVTSAGAGAASDQMPFTIPARGSIIIDPIAQGGVASASAQVFATMPLAGTASTTLLGAVSGLSESLFVDSVTLPVREESATGAGTGVIIVNGAVRTNVKLTLHARSGQELPTGSAAIDLPPYGRRLLFVRDFFPTLGDFQGSMTVEGGIDRPQEGGPIAVTVVQRVGASGLVTHPPIPVSPAPSLRVLRFASFPSGGDAVSSITLVNPSRFDRARGTLAFFDESGAPRSLSINGAVAAASVPYDLAPYGSMTFTTATGGPVRNGSARADAIEGVAGGVVRVLTAPTAAIDSGPSEAVTSFIAPVRRDRAAGMTTEVTVASTGAPATLQLALRDTAGTPVAGGTATLRLPANGQAQRTLDELFPSSGQGTLQGTLTATSDTAVVTRVALLGANAPRVLMPVVPLR